MIDSKEGEGGSDGKLCSSEKKRGKIWKDYMEMIRNKGQNVERETVGLVEMSKHYGTETRWYRC